MGINIIEEDPSRECAGPRENDVIPVFHRETEQIYRGQ